MGFNVEQWADVCAVEDIPLRGARVVKTPAGCVALFRTFDGAVFALDDRCPHKGGPLSQGIVHARAVTCPLHGWVISLDTGRAQAPDKGAVRTRRAQVVDGRVRLLVAGADAAAE
ncbi:nitrite reductase small subunit NirD [Amphiplicatus metriothermophilus]|uniref:Assimilatory nitrite reductase (NAD(P)H) small subunit n=1 Tax=Amphiplicatus metriothermophilus TaxID=1519374 RepID=A0A239PPB9_9PROT|nr:nitrite reductase small subunit NirD [Amphiplicatus metriothermophilus]MBB5518692.1 nitrite reductase (NADH) small subunit [Amphiplicatus metriothermophilus]SNT72151.1 assimilatory nitrite reductase (NAD(P)H) small subunit [Amphiplicatus metriothermophilus]